MIVIGLLLLIIAAAFGIDLVWKNSVHIANPTVFGERLGIHSAASLFVVGAVTGAAVIVGVALLLWGLRRKGASALSRRHERVETRHLREDRTKLRSEREDVRSSENEQPGSKLDENDDAKAQPASVPGGSSAD